MNDSQRIAVLEARMRQLERMVSGNSRDIDVLIDCAASQQVRDTLLCNGSDWYRERRAGLMREVEDVLGAVTKGG